MVLKAAGDQVRSDQLVYLSFAMAVLGGNRYLSACRCESNLEVVQLFMWSCSCSAASLCARYFWNGGMEKVMTCNFAVLLTCSVRNGNNWK